MRRIWVLLACAVLVFGGVACGDDAQDTAGDVADEAEDAAQNAAEEARDAAEDAADRAEDVVDDETVNIDNNAYEPADLEITRGQEVTWVNQDSVDHTVTAKDESFESERLGEGDEFSERFLEDGTFEYFCEVHGEDTMSGTVTVADG
jgi:plastocyanin